MKYYVIWYGAVIPEWYQQKIDAMRAFVESHGHTFVLLHFTDFTGTQKEAAILKDKQQLEMCCMMPDAAIIDADCDLFGIPKLLPDKPYFEKLYPGIIGPGYTIVNNCCQFFIDCFRYKNENGIQDVYAFLHKLYRGRQNEVYFIDDSSFKHYRRMNADIKTRNS
jgi:hypothetical protein